MSPFLQFALALAFLIAAAKLGGLISLKLGQPSVLGELIVGIILGPSLLDVLNWQPFTDKHLGETLAHLAELGVLLLMFIAGLELHFDDLVKSGRVAAYAGILGVVLPVSMGFLLMRLNDFSIESAIFTGLILAATSVSISAQTLMEMGTLRTRVGIGLLGAAVFDDILVVLGLSALIALLVSSSAGALSVLWIVFKMVGFLLFFTFVGIKLIPGLSTRIELLPISQGLIAFAFVIVLFFAWASEILGGMAAITGAFLAGLSFAYSPAKERVLSGMAPLAYGVFVPIFFINVGLASNLRELAGSSLGLLALICLVAILSKLLGGGIGAKLAGLSWRQSLQIGAGLMSRGEVGLIVASVGISEGLIAPDIFSMIVAVVLVTTLVTPVALRSFNSESDHLQ